MSKNRVFMPAFLPFVLRRCHPRALGRFAANGSFHIPVNHEFLDAWLLAPYTGRGKGAGPTVLGRVNGRSPQRAFPNPLRGNGPGPAAALLPEQVVRRRGVGGPGRTDRPAWQSPYGPPPRRSARGRWAPVPVPARSRLPERRGFLCGRCD
ncbi:hypothetical protein [Streptomyces hoynatensis]|uniref:hypothetical protein n=1 Tax=Streptomyces hoynatensis TaxID=1141874 RepID=UPI001576E017|nr:hypothetical protein [Streptomyces hoynatensis]